MLTISNTAHGLFKETVSGSPERLLLNNKSRHDKMSGERKKLENCGSCTHDRKYHTGKIWTRIQYEDETIPSYDALLGHCYCTSTVTYEQYPTDITGFILILTSS